MKWYIAGSLLLIAVYFFNGHNNNDFERNSLQSGKSKVTQVNKEKTNYIESNISSNIKEEIDPEQMETKETRYVGSSKNEKILPSNILNKILLLKKGDKNDIPLQKEIAGLEIDLINKLKTMRGLEEDTYNLLENILDSDIIDIERKKYVINILNSINNNDANKILIKVYDNTEDIELKKAILKLKNQVSHTLLALEAEKNGYLDDL